MSAAAPGEDEPLTAALARALGERPLRAYPAVASAEAEALAWARAGAPHGAVVAADHHLAARGRRGEVWEVRPGRDACWSVVLRPRLSPRAEGLLYLAGALALAAAAGREAVTEWPDTARRGPATAGRVAVRAQPATGTTLCAVLSLLLVDPPGAPAEAVVAALETLEAAVEQPPEDLLAAYHDRCATLGQRVTVHPAATSGRVPALSGVATGCRPDGGLALDTGDGRRVVVLPQQAGVLERH